MKINTLVLLTAFLFFTCQSSKQIDINLDYSPEKAELFANGIVSTHLYERDIAISPEGDEIIYTLSDSKHLKRCLVGIKKVGDRWHSRQILNFSGKYSDIEPFISPDGRNLYFASTRPMNADTSRTDFNIWVSQKKETGWSEPIPLPLEINTVDDEFFPSVSKNNNLYFTASRKNGIGKEDIFLSRFVDGKYLAPESLDTNVNSLNYEFNAWISPEEDLIVFSSYGRKDDLGGGDLYYSRKDKSGNWISAKNLGSTINSAHLDYCPFIDLPRKNFYFTSDRVVLTKKRLENIHEIETFSDEILNGYGNIYVIGLSGIFN